MVSNIVRMVSSIVRMVSIALFVWLVTLFVWLVTLFVLFVWLVTLYMVSYIVRMVSNIVRMVSNIVRMVSNIVSILQLLSLCYGPRILDKGGSYGYNTIYAKKVVSLQFDPSLQKSCTCAAYSFVYVCTHAALYCGHHNHIVHMHVCIILYKRKISATKNFVTSPGFI